MPSAVYILTAMKRFLVLPFLAALAVVAASAQRGEFAPEPSELDEPHLGSISIGADRAGRKAFCGEVVRLAGLESPTVRLVPGDIALGCPAPLFNRILLRAEHQVSDPVRVVCDFATQPAAALFWKMRPIAIRNGAVPWDAAHLERRLENVGARKMGRVLEAFGFKSVVVQTPDQPAAAEEVGVHELGLACPEAA